MDNKNLTEEDLESASGGIGFIEEVYFAILRDICYGLEIAAKELYRAHVNEFSPRQKTEIRQEFLEKFKHPID